MWEIKVSRIERGDYAASDFIAELKQLISLIVISVLSDNSARRIVIEDPAPTKPARKPRSRAAAKK